MNRTPTSPDRPTTGLDGNPDGTALLGHTAELGEYFSLRVEGDAEGDLALRALPTLLDDASVVDFVDRTRDAIARSADCALSRIPLRVAASSFHLAVAARLLSPIVGAAVCFGTVPVLNTRSVAWYTVGDHAPRFAATDAQWVATPTSSAAAAVISESVLTAIFAPLHEKLSALTALSPQVTWGNVVSAVNGAVTVLAIGQPAREAPGRALVRSLLGTDRLTGTATFADGTFSRRSCCLFYQAPNSGLCTDCVLG